MTVSTSSNHSNIGIGLNDNDKKKPLYLLTDEGVVRRLMTCLVMLSVIGSLVMSYPPTRLWVEDVYSDINQRLLETAHSYAWWSLLGLLSSSCCALQLILNAFSFGCAGFNTVLGPIRPLFLAITILTQTTSWYVAWNRPWQWQPTMVATVLTGVTSFLPELLAIRNNHMTTRRMTEDGVDNDDDDDDDGINAEENNLTAVLRFRMDSVGCAACLTTVNGVLRKYMDTTTSSNRNISKSGSISSYETDMDTGILTVYYYCNNNNNRRLSNKSNGDKDEAGKLLLKKLLDELEQVGFPMTYLSP